MAEAGGRQAGFAIDEVSDVGDLPDPAEETESDLLVGATLADGELIGIIDVPRVFDALGRDAAMTGFDTEFIELFRDETARRLDDMDNLLLAIESGDADADAVNSLFRHAHTIKGAAGMLGFRRRARAGARRRGRAGRGA